MLFLEIKTFFLDFYKGGKNKVKSTFTFIRNNITFYYNISKSIIIVVVVDVGVSLKNKEA